jgi:hypothetical protein
MKIIKNFFIVDLVNWIEKKKTVILSLCVKVKNIFLIFVAIYFLNYYSRYQLLKLMITKMKKIK